MKIVANVKVFYVINVWIILVFIKINVIIV